MHFWIDKRGQQRCCVHAGGRGRRSAGASVPVTARGRRRKPMAPFRTPSGPSSLSLSSPPPQLQPPSLPSAPSPQPVSSRALRYAVAGVAFTFMCFLGGINFFKGSGFEGVFCVLLVIAVLAGCTVAMCHMKSGYESSSVESPQTAAPPAQIQLPDLPAPPPPIPILTMEEMPPPPYEIAILIPEAPPPSYDKAVG